MPANSIFIIQPYKHLGMWVFDDDSVGLVKEPFVAGADVVIDRAVVNFPDAETGFILLFSANPFPGAHIRFKWRREDMGGNWYYVEALDMEGWLCPALLKYFDKAPKELYAQFRQKDQ